MESISDSKTKTTKRCTVPLLGLFIGQSILVAASFAAVILVLALQQSSQFEDAVHDRVRLHLVGSSATISGPLLARELANDQVTYRLQNDPSLWFGDDMTLSSPNVQRFINLTYAVVQQDPLITAINQVVRHSTKRTPAGYPIFGILALTPTGITATSNFDYAPETANGAVQSGYPLNFATTLLGYPLPVTTEEFHMTQFVALQAEWGKGTIFNNPITNTITVTAGISTPLLLGHLDPANTSSPIGGVVNFAYSLDITFLTKSAGDSLLSPNSRLLVYDSLSEYIMTSRNAGAGTWNVAANTHWVLDTFPDQDLVAAFIKYRAQAPCTAASCDVLIDAKAGDQIATLLQIQTPRGFQMQVFQLTPRSYFFAAGRRSIAIGVSIGVIAAVLVLVSCILIWLAVRGPVRHLQEGMDLAAHMRNDEVRDTSSRISEINALAITFHHMNRRLLQARAFMPQALLISSPPDSLEDADSDWSANDEGEIEMDDKLASGKFTRESSINPGVNRLLGKEPSLSSKSVTSSHHSRKQSSSGAHHGAISNAMRGGLALRKVSVLAINARGTHDVCKRGAAALEHHENRLVQHIEASVAGEKGVVDSFQGDHFVVTFNAARAVGTPERNAALAALAIADSGSGNGLQFSMGVSAGKVFVGNVGTATMKKHCTVGAAFSNAMALEQLARSCGWACLSHGRCVSEATYSVDYVMLGYGSLVSGSEDAVCAVVQPNTRTLSDDKDAEWMYVVEGGTTAASDPFSTYNAAFNLCLVGDFATAATILTAELNVSACEESRTSPIPDDCDLWVRNAPAASNADGEDSVASINAPMPSTTTTSPRRPSQISFVGPGEFAQRTNSQVSSTSTFKAACNLAAVTAKLQAIIQQNQLSSTALPTSIRSGSSHQKGAVSEPLAILLTSELLHHGPLIKQAREGAPRTLGFHLGKPYTKNPGAGQ